MEAQADNQYHLIQEFQLLRQDFLRYQGSLKNSHKILNILLKLLLHDQPDNDLCQSKTKDEKLVLKPVSKIIIWNFALAKIVY